VRLASMASHPGYAATNLQFAGPSHWWEQLGGWIGNKTVAQSAEMGALPSLFAATKPDLPSGSYVGPDQFLEQRGHPHVVTARAKAYDEDAWRRLWDVSEELTGVTYTFRAVSLREDGSAALEWAADYLDRVHTLPVLAQVEPGEIRARLPATAPEETRAVRGRAPRPRRGADAGRHPLAAPTPLRLLRDQRIGARDPRGSCSPRR